MQSKAKLWSGHYVLAILIGTLSGMAFYIANPILSKYIITLGGTSALAGFVVGLFSITSLVARPLSGFFADRLDKRMLWLVSTSILALASLAYFLSQSVYQIIFFRVFHGLAFAMSSTATIAVITDLIPKERLGEGLGFNSISLVLASAVGPALSVWLGDKIGYRFSFLMAFGILAFTALLMLIFFTPKKMQVKDTVTKLPRLDQMLSLKVLPLAFTNATFSFVLGILSSFMLLYGESRNISGISLYFTVYSIFLFVARPLSGRLSDSKIGNYLYYPAMLCTALGLCLLAFAHSIQLVLVAAAFLALGIGSAAPMLQSGCIKRLGQQKVGLATGTFYFGSDIGQGVGPMFAGVVSGMFGYNVLFFSCIGVLCIGCTVYTLFIKSEKAGKRRENANV